MFFKKLKRNKKGNWVLPVTAFYVLFNICLFVILLLYSTDPAMTGQIESSGTLSINESLQEGEFSWTSLDDNIEGYRVEVTTGIPWWFKIIFFGFEFVLGALLIFAWIRGV